MRTLTILSTAAVLAVSGLVHAATISMKYASNTVSFIGATEVAGAPGASAINWNNRQNAGTSTNINDNTGAATTLDVGFTQNAGGFFVVTPVASQSPTTRLFNDYTEAGSAGNTATISQIPYTSYNLYIYLNNYSPRGGFATVNGVTQYLKARGNPNNDVGAYTLATGLSTSTAQTADTILFTGLTTPTLSFTYGNFADTISGANSGNIGLGGFQVVEVVTAPEPTSLALLGLGATGLLARRRK